MCCATIFIVSSCIRRLKSFYMECSRKSLTKYEFISLVDEVRFSEKLCNVFGLIEPYKSFG